MKRDPRLRIQVPEVERGVRWRHLRRVPAQQRVEQHRRAEWLGDRTFDTRTVVLTLVLITPVVASYVLFFLSFGVWSLLSVPVLAVVLVFARRVARRRRVPLRELLRRQRQRRERQRAAGASTGRSTSAQRDGR